MSTQRLGRGLRALIPEPEPERPRAEVQYIEVGLIEPNPYQPRQQFDQEKLEELAQSIAELGLLEPVLVRRTGETYQLVAGERRVRAARMAGLTEVPALVREFGDLEMMQVALIENLQREDLNPIEEAEGYQRLIDEFGFTQSEAAEAVGKKRSSIANALRLLNLDEEEKELVRRGLLSVGHAKVLLGVANKKKRAELAKKVVAEDLSVRQLEELVRRPQRVPRGTTRLKSPELVQLEEDLQRRFGTKVTVSYRKGAGKISIEYYSDEELERLLDLISKI
ncbi:MAG TPA: ParB/RepB/Spo0J family partition protein [Limnochordia bacterium]|nr:ParB/RepB/Spo0J family partition protein [Limnochordia bacterium]